MKEPNLWDHHTRCPVPKQPRFYKISTLNGLVCEHDGAIAVNTTISAQKEVSGIWDGNSIMCWRHPAIGFCLQPIIEGFPTAELWECEGDARLATIEGLVACQTVRITRAMNLHLGLLNLIRFASACVAEVQKDPHFNNWMLDWWNGQEKAGYLSSEEICRISWRVAERELPNKYETAKHKVFAPKAFIFYAAHYLASACWKFSLPDIKTTVVKDHIAQAVMYAIYAADQLEQPLDPISLIEKSFSSVLH